MFKRNLNLGVSSTQFHFEVNRLLIELFSTPIQVLLDTYRIIESSIPDSIMNSSLNTGLPREVVLELVPLTPSRS